MELHNSAPDPDLPEPTSGPIVLVGNGPSLRTLDWRKLDGVPSWGMNLIDLWYDKTDWRPTRWWWADHAQNEAQVNHMIEHVRNYPEEEIWLRQDLCEMATGVYPAFGDLPFIFDELPDNVTPWQSCSEHAAAVPPDKRAPVKLHMMAPRRLCKPGTSIMALYAQAVWEGYDPIYVVGCDGGYTAGDGTDSHVHENYYKIGGGKPITQEAADYNNFLVQWQHTLMQQFADEHGRKIYNLHGWVDVHERVDDMV